MMQLIDRIRLYAGGKGCPWVAIPFEDGTKMLFKRRVLQVALESPVCAAVVTERGICLNGTAQATYHLFDRLRDQKINTTAPTYNPNRWEAGSRTNTGLLPYQVKDAINKWAESRRKAAATRLLTPEQRHLAKAEVELAKLERRMRKQYGGSRPTPPQSPFVSLAGPDESFPEYTTEDRKEIEAWYKACPLRRRIARIVGGFYRGAFPQKERAVKHYFKALPIPPAFYKAVDAIAPQPVIRESALPKRARFRGWTSGFGDDISRRDAYLKHIHQHCGLTERKPWSLRDGYETEAGRQARTKELERVAVYQQDRREWREQANDFDTLQSLIAEQGRYIAFLKGEQPEGCEN